MTVSGFLKTAGEAVLQLTSDIKVLLRIFDDPELDDESRVEFAGMLIHLLSGTNALPGLRGLLTYLDDVVVLRIVLQRAKGRVPEVIARYANEEPELVGQLDAFLAEASAYLGEAIMPALQKSAERATELSHQGHSARSCANDDAAGTWLYETVGEAMLDWEFDEGEVMRSMKELDALVPQVRKQLEVRPAK